MNFDHLHCKQSFSDIDNVIVSFDYTSLSSYDGELIEVANCLFKQGEYWKDRKTLYDAVKSYAALTGFCVYLDVEYIRCNRYGTSQIRKKKNDPSTLQEKRNIDKLKIGCTFSIKVNSSQKIKKATKNAYTKLPYKWRNDFSDNIPVMISVANCLHCI